MSFTRTISIKDNATPALAAFEGRMSGLPAKKVAGAFVQKGWQAKLRALPSNKAGFPSLNYWGETADSMTNAPTADGFEVVVHQVGFRVRAEGTGYLPGGVISPKGGRKFLTFAANPFAYGKRAREITGLKFGRAINPATGHMQFMLYSWSGSERVSTAQNRERTGKGKFRAQIKAGDIAFWLARSSRQEGNPNCLLTPDEIARLISNGLGQLAKGAA